MACASGGVRLAAAARAGRACGGALSVRCWRKVASWPVQSDGRHPWHTVGARVAVRVREGERVLPCGCALRGRVYASAGDHGRECDGKIGGHGVVQVG